MSTGIYRVTHGGPGNIKWEKLPESSGQVQNAMQIANNASSILAAGFSIASVIQNQIIIHKINAIAKDVKQIKARFDLLFLDRSIDYFIEGHANRVGLDRSLLGALIEDCGNALVQVVENPELYVPGFLRHRLQVLSQALYKFNELHYAVLHKGELNTLEVARVESWAKGIKSLQGANPDGGLCKQVVIIESWRKEMATRESQKGTGMRIPFSRDDRPVADVAVLPGNIERSVDVLTLWREADTAARLYDVLDDRLKLATEPLLLLAE